jgi:uncharacterized protein with ParB-like and HNH nuclease domain
MSEIITAINAKPETIFTFLTNQYVIPDYQRPYSWDAEIQCSKLWEDIIDFFENQNNADDIPYFLGNVVVFNFEKKRYVVDGQQRLITLNLLIKAILQNNGTYSILENCLYQISPITGKVIDPLKIRIEHDVLGGSEKIKLEEVLLNNFEDENSKYYKNFNFFNEKFIEHTRNFNSTQKEKLITDIIYNIVILPIECTNLESALTIFETINNRGMDLSDADIFKSKLYKFAGRQKDEFIDQWNEISNNLEKEKTTDLKRIFTHYMHIIRGDEKIIETIKGLRKFYDEDKSRRLSNWQDVLNSIKKLIGAWEYITISNENGGASNRILNWVTILRHYPNSYWEYPIMTFLHKYSKINDNDDFIFDIEKEEDFLDLLKITTKYCYFKWLKYRNITSVKDTIFKVVRDISHSGSYKKTYYDDIKEGSIKDDLDKENLGKGQKGICLLNAVLRETREVKIPEDFHVEHILPKKWERYNYPDWTDGTYKSNHERLGNLIILEAGKNIKVGNKPFADKKIEYQKSILTETRELANKYSNWSHRDCKQRHYEILEYLAGWFLRKD